MVKITSHLTQWLCAFFKRLLARIILADEEQTLAFSLFLFTFIFQLHPTGNSIHNAQQPRQRRGRESLGRRRMWTVRLEGGPRRVNHAAVAINGRIFSFGGYCTGEDYSTRKPIDVHVLSTVSLRWALIPCQSNLEDVPFQRYGHTVVAYGDYAYLWGGRNDDGACNILYRFDTSTSLWSRPKVTGSIPGARDGHSACVMGNHMYVFGGYEEQADRFSQEVHVLDFETMHWQYVYTRGLPPQWRDFHSATALGHRMYVWGGRGDSQGPFHSQREVYCNRIAYLDTPTSTWVHPPTYGDIPRGRRSHSAFVYKGELYIFGGYNGLRLCHFGDMYKYDAETSVWTKVNTLRDGPCARRRQCCCIVGDKLYLFGGTSPLPVQPAQRLQDFEPPDQTLMDHSDLHVLDFAPTLKTLSLLAVIEARLDISNLPQDIRWEISTMTTNNSISRPLQMTG
ncbi:kelch domain-containing protein 3-like isoform X2 [Ornithodoros turicata]|uniref:kelch domain-containing protein 3-like isoform X2 n=1 Tax=Ornithodoros turicata TaxID=34597 RepID=UPI0031388239